MGATSPPLLPTINQFIRRARYLFSRALIGQKLDTTLKAVFCPILASYHAAKNLSVVASKFASVGNMHLWRPMQSHEGEHGVRLLSYFEWVQHDCVSIEYLAREKATEVLVQPHRSFISALCITGP